MLPAPSRTSLYFKWSKIIYCPKSFKNIVISIQEWLALFKSSQGPSPWQLAFDFVDELVDVEVVAEARDKRGAAQECQGDEEARGASSAGGVEEEREGDGEEGHPASSPGDQEEEQEEKEGDGNQQQFPMSYKPGGQHLCRNRAFCESYIH